ncbi:hypothetical protein BDA96_10G072700 [Sorghum bicolor]|uniref:Uncharacterized protein n=1 Tax=Sorghum bicolor TaxID=4558 RepID=A0A921Q0A2_SORBI|nr:hypothetical protein BDA96_10G072700 [Sorghum bicolor]
MRRVSPYGHLAVLSVCLCSCSCCSGLILDHGALLRKVSRAHAPVSPPYFL